MSFAVEVVVVMYKTKQGIWHGASVAALEVIQALSLLYKGAIHERHWAERKRSL